MEFLYISDTLKFATLGCVLLGGVELLQSKTSPSRKPAICSLMDIAYLITCAGTCAALVVEGCHLVRIGSWCTAWTPKLCLDLFYVCAFCISTVFMCVVFIVKRLRSQGAPGIACAVHGLILTALISDVFDTVEGRWDYALAQCDNLRNLALANRIILLSGSAFLALGNFLTVGLADRPTVQDTTLKVPFYVFMPDTGEEPVIVIWFSECNVD
ncbi:uncharacterized protein LOC144097798 [Amblyomma americanum]